MLSDEDYNTLYFSTKNNDVTNVTFFYNFLFILVIVIMLLHSKLIFL